MYLMLLFIISLIQSNVFVLKYMSLNNYRLRLLIVGTLHIVVTNPPLYFPLSLCHRYSNIAVCIILQSHQDIDTETLHITVHIGKLELDLFRLLFNDKVVVKVLIHVNLKPNLWIFTCYGLCFLPPPPTTLSYLKTPIQRPWIKIFIWIYKNMLQPQAMWLWGWRIFFNVLYLPDKWRTFFKGSTIYHGDT